MSSVVTPALKVAIRRSVIQAALLCVGVTLIAIGVDAEDWRWGALGSLIGAAILGVYVANSERNSGV